MPALRPAAWLCGGLLAAGAAQGADPCATLQPAVALQQVNAAREQGAACGGRSLPAAAPPLQWSAPLQALAEAQARWLAERGALAHTGRHGETLRQRAEAAGYDYVRIAENVAHGQLGVAQVLDGWTASAGHCVNLHDTRVTEMALACVPGRDGRPFWALLLARPAPREAAAPPR